MTLSWWQGLILGLVQGFTEFLPISSSGHLVLAERMVGFKPQGLFFEVVVHVATLLSVFIAYRARIAALLRGMLSRDADSLRFAGLILLASVPAGVVGVVFKDFFEQSFHSPVMLGWNFLITAVLLWSTKYALQRAPVESAPITPLRAFMIGVGQAIAIIPGISRSGTTIAVALWSGVKPAVAAEFSFLMSIVVIAGSGILQAREIPPGFDPFSPGIVLAFLSALVAGVVAIRFLVALLKSSRFHSFAPYCAALGIFCLIWFGVLGR